VTAGELERRDGWNEERRRAALEVLEVGQALFDAVIESASDQREGPASEDEGEKYPDEELRAAAEAFFEAVRVLLGLDHPGEERPGVARHSS
jgi:hypothetical protein